MVSNATFNNMSVKRHAVLVEETGEKHRPYFFSSQKFVRVTPPTHIRGGFPKTCSCLLYQMKILISLRQTDLTLISLRQTDLTIFKLLPFTIKIHRLFHQTVCTYNSSYILNGSFNVYVVRIESKVKRALIFVLKITVDLVFV